MFKTQKAFYAALSVVAIVSALSGFVVGRSTEASTEPVACAEGLKHEPLQRSEGKGW